MSRMKRELDDMLQRAEAAGDCAARAEAKRRWNELWQLERRRAASVQADLEAGAQVFLDQARLRQAFRRISQGEPPRERNLLEPVAGGTAAVAWPGGEERVAMSYIEGDDFVIESFAVEHR